MGRWNRAWSRSKGRRAAPLVALLLAASSARPAHAMCNLIPLSVAEYRSTQGLVDRSIAHPGGPLSRPDPVPAASVTLRVDLACSPTAPGFEPDPTRNRVTLRFELDGREVSVDPAQVSVANCGKARCDSLSFRVPDTDALVAPAGDGIGLAGPATILVRSASGGPLAEIGPLFAPSRSCDDREPEAVFEHFTLLPRLNDFGAVATGATPRVLATLDGGDNLVIPFDYRNVLAAPPGAPIFRILAGSADLPAFPSDPGTPIRIPDTGFPFVRSFSIIGRPLPPILEATAPGDEIFGTVDGSEGIIRVARRDLWAGTPPIYDLRSRVAAGGGNLVIGPAEQVSLEVREAAPLEGLSASPQVVSFIRDEAREGADLNGDGDHEDLVAELIDVGTATSTPTLQAVTRTVSAFRFTPALVAEGDLAAFVGEDPGDRQFSARSTRLRVFTAAGGEPTGSSPPSADAVVRVDGRSLAIRDAGSPGGAPEPRVVFRQPAGFPGILAPAGVAELEDAEVSPDGRHLYLWIDMKIAIYRIEPDGDLIDVGSAAVPGIFPAFVDGVLTPDGGLVITLLRANESVVHARDPLTGGLSLVEHLTHSALVGRFTASTLLSPDEPVPSPDGRFLYVPVETQRPFNEPNDVGVATFEVGPGGRLSVVDEFYLLTGASGLVRQSLAITRDGRHLYASASARDCATGPPCGRIATFTRDAASGLLDRSDPAGDPAFPLLHSAQLSADDRFVHASAARITGQTIGSFYLQSFRRDPATGALELDWESDSLQPVGFLGVGVPDASHLYAASSAAPLSELLRPSRDSGELTIEPLHGAGLAGVPSGGGLSTVAASPDGRHIYLFFSDPDPGDRIGVVDVAQRLGVFDPVSQASLLDASTAPGASRVATAGAQALILTPESLDGVDLNGNGVPGPGSAGENFLDRVAQRVALRDPGAPGAVVSLGVAGAAIALSEGLAAVLVPEAQQPAPAPPVGAGCPAGVRDLNGDCDERDLVLHVHAPAEPAPARPVGVSGVAIGVLGRRVVLVTDEASEAGRVLNGDGDALDRVIRVYDDGRPEPLPADRIAELGLAADDFVLGETLLAFRVSEAAQSGPVAAPGCAPAAGGGCDLNGDGDAADSVMHAYDLETGELVNTKRAASLCDFAGCGPFLEPYRIREHVDRSGNRIRTLSFLTRESEQGTPGGAAGPGCLPLAAQPGVCDLNGDGDGDDLVVEVLSLNSRAYQVVEVSEDPEGDPGVPPFPDTAIGRTVLHVQLPESTVGRDVNEDGVVDDTALVFIAGDSDEDGTLDAATVGEDTCPEAPNPEQLDADGDRLGDETCDPDPTSVPAGEQGLLCDLDGTGTVTGADIEVLAADVPMQVFGSDPRDPDGDGQVTELDVALCRGRCSASGCPGNVAVDVRPDDVGNTVNPRSQGVIPVAILGSPVRDVTRVDVTTLRFGPAGARPAHKKGGHLEDANGDGTLDLVSHYRVQETGISIGDRQACLDALTVTGEALGGCDRIRVLGGCGLGYELVLALPFVAWLRGRRRRLVPRASSAGPSAQHSRSAPSGGARCAKR